MVRRLAVAVCLLPVLVSGVRAQQGRPPTYDGERITDLPGVEVRTTAAVDPIVSWAVARVCALAAGVCRERLGLEGPEVVRVSISTTDEHWSSVVTDRDAAIYIVYNEQTGIGEQERKHPQPVGILCQATAELLNDHRVPGLERYASAMLAVPAVWESEAETAWPRLYPYLRTDGPEAFEERCAEENVLGEHPDRAAAATLWHVAEALGVPWLADRLAALRGQGPAALEELRVAAVAADPALGGAFAAWQQATALPLEADGSLLLTSFETEEQMGVLDFQAGVRLAPCREWSTHGEQSLAVTFTGPTPWPMLAVFDEDWRYRDWSGFSVLELDVHNPGDQPVRLCCEAFDAPDRGHAHLTGDVALAPGREGRCRVELQSAPSSAPWRTSVHYEGQPRLGEISGLLLCVPGPLEAPVTLWLDHLRLCP